MATTSSPDVAGGSPSQVHPITQSQDELVPAASLNPPRIMLSMGCLFAQLRASTWVGALCKTVSALKNMKAGFWSHIMVAVPLLLAKWTAIKDFIEFCQSFDWKPAGCELQPDSLGPPPVLRRQLPPWPLNPRISSTFNPITFVALSFSIFCLLVKLQKRRMRPLFQGSFCRLPEYRQRRHVLPTPLLSVLDSSDATQILQPTSIAQSTGLEVSDHVPRRRPVGSDSERRLHSISLNCCDRTEDDNGIELQPERHVDYLSHVWQEDDLHQSWRHVLSQKTNYENAARLENAAWRSWTKFRNNLSTISPNLIKWSKDDDITWLYGPLQPRTTGLYALKTNVSGEKQEIIQKGELTKRKATLEAEEGDQYETVCGQLGLDAATTQISRQTLRQVGNLKHGRRLGKSSARNISIQAEPKEVRFKEEF
ncbi:hypothetical protein LI328DRAFT_165976 [Trichoderma asperelloides]|nr:hypothetical protein LI328DRAFT_165976 [Trichoderma asperelloides]